MKGRIGGNALCLDPQRARRNQLHSRLAEGATAAGVVDFRPRLQVAHQVARAIRPEMFVLGKRHRVWEANGPATTVIPANFPKPAAGLHEHRRPHGRRHGQQ